jgi:hypothetical protein
LFEKGGAVAAIKENQLRFQEARSILRNERKDVGTVSQYVGYESSSQFSRKYSRLFGNPPVREISNFSQGKLQQFAVRPRAAPSLATFRRKYKASLQVFMNFRLVDMGLGTFARGPGIRLTPFLRSPLIVIQPDKDPAFRRASITWSALKGEKLISLYPHSPIQNIINKHLAEAGVALTQTVFINLLDTQIAMVHSYYFVLRNSSVPQPKNRHGPIDQSCSRDESSFD